MSSNKIHCTHSSSGGGDGGGTKCTNYVSHFDSVVAVHYLSRILILSAALFLALSLSLPLYLCVCLSVCVDLTTVYVFKADV